MGVVLHLLPHFLLLLTLLKAEMLFLRLEPSGLLFSLKLLIMLLLLVMFCLAVNFLADSLEFRLSFHSLSCRVIRVIRSTRRRSHIVAYMVIIPFFGIWVLKHLISLFDINELFIE